MNYDVVKYIDYALAASTKAISSGVRFCLICCMLSEITHLGKHLEIINYKSSGMKPLRPEDRFGFFPYGTGIFGCDFPTNGIMILGQDFGNEEYVDGLNGKQESLSKSATWRNLLVLLEKGSIEFTDCFFTNAIMGMREKGEKMTGKAPPFNSKKYSNGSDFLKKCFNFLEKQVDLQKPKLIICLGRNVYSFLKLHSIDQLDKFPDKANYGEISRNFFHIKNVTISNHRTQLCLVIHPSTPNRTNNRTVVQDAGAIKTALNN